MKARKSWYKEFVRSNKRDETSTYNTKYIEEIEPNVHIHVNNFNEWIEDFLRRENVINTFSHVMRIDNSTLKETLKHRTQFLETKERVAQCSSGILASKHWRNNILWCYHLYTGELYAEYWKYSTYPHEKIHAIDFWKRKKWDNEIILSQKLSPLLRNIIDYNILFSVNKNWETANLADKMLDYELSDSELFTRILSIFRELELNRTKEELMNKQLLTYEDISKIRFNRDIEQILPYLKKDELMWFINSLYWKKWKPNHTLLMKNHFNMYPEPPQVME